MRKTPFDRIKKNLSGLLPLDCIRLLPEKWEKIGTVVVLKIPEELRWHQDIIGRMYAEELGCTSALNDVGGISGVYRTPVVKVIWGSSQTETIHKENGIRYKLDPQKVMFSSGNMAERKRMGMISNPKETVVDLFAGIGYFTIPMAVQSKPRKIFACEINQVAYEYLCKNIVLNHVTNIVEPLLGDNRKTAPKDCADRVLIGYLEDTERYLPVAFESLRKQTGILHYHDAVPNELILDRPLRQIQRVASEYDRMATLLMVKEIKSYAPGVSHVVLDVRIGEE